MNDATMVVVMMETVAALEHVEEIAAVDGVDLMLVGTNDLPDYALSSVTKRLIAE